MRSVRQHLWFSFAVQTKYSNSGYPYPIYFLGQRERYPCDSTWSRGYIHNDHSGHHCAAKYTTCNNDECNSLRWKYDRYCDDYRACEHNTGNYRCSTGKHRHYKACRDCSTQARLRNYIEAVALFLCYYCAAGSYRASLRSPIAADLIVMIHHAFLILLISSR